MSTRQLTTLIALLRIRILFVLTFPFLLVARLSSSYHNYINRWLYYEEVNNLFRIRERFKIADYIFENFAVIVDGKFYLLLASFLSTLYFLIILFVIHFAANYISSRITHKKLFLIGSLFVIGLSCFVYCSLIRHLTFSLAFGLSAAIMFIYLFDVILFGSRRLLQSGIARGRLGRLFILTPVFAEVLATPFYLDFIGWVKVSKLGHKATASTKYLHFFILTLLILIMLTPIKSRHIGKGINLKEGKFYGMAISQKASELFFCNEAEGRIESLNLDGRSEIFNTVYTDYQFKADYPYYLPKLSEIIDVNDDRGELYTINRLTRELVIIDLNDYSIKGVVFYEGFDYGDSRIASGNNFLFVVNDDVYCNYIYKIDPAIPKVIIQNRIDTRSNFLSYDQDRNVLYTNNWVLNTVGSRIRPRFFLYEVSGQTLQNSRKISTPGGCWSIVVSEEGKRLFCALPFESLFRSYVYIFDAKSFDLIDKIKVPLGTRTIAVDEEKNILIAGSALTNFVELIDLKSKKTLKMYRTGNYSLRHIVLDKKRKAFFVSTEHFGLFKGCY